MLAGSGTTPAAVNTRRIGTLPFCAAPAQDAFTAVMPDSSIGAWLAAVAGAYAFDVGGAKLSDGGMAIGARSCGEREAVSLPPWELPGVRAAVADASLFG